MKRKTLIRFIICLLAVLIVELSFIGFSHAKYARSYTVTQSLSVNIAANQYTLTLDANGGAFADNSATKTKPVEYKGNYGELASPARRGYTFDGWFTAKTDGTKVDANDTVEITQNTTIYAHWTANTYKVKYDANGGTGSMDDQNLTYDTEKTLSANAFSRTGYTFTGWNTKADGTGSQFTDKANVLNLTAEPNSVVVLYAQWRINSYRVDLYSNLLYGLEDTETEVVAEGIKYTIQNKRITGTGINQIDPQDCYGYSSAWVTLEAGKTYRFTADCDGTFGGWDSDVEVRFMLGGENWDGNTSKRCKTSSTDCTFTPNYSGEYCMRFEVNQLGETHWLDNINVAEKIGSITVTSETGYTDLYIPTRQGYTFDKWVDLDEMTYGTTTALTKNEDHALFAQWIPNSYNIQFHANGATGDMGTQTFIYDIAQKLNANTLTKEGYGFAGWNTKADGSGTAYADEAEIRNLAEGGSVTLYAQWIMQNYTIRFEANGGEGAMADVKAMFDEPVTLTTNLFTRTGYKFTGWNTKADGNGVAYTDGASVMNVPSSDGVVSVLYAQWEKLPAYTLIYDANGGTGGPKAQTVYADAENQAVSFDISAEIPTYVSASGVSYVFLGWSEDASLTAALQYSADGSNVEDPGQTLKTVATIDYADSTKTKTLYAVWGVTYRLSYDAGAGEGVPASEEKFGRLTGCTFDVDSETRPQLTDHEFRYWTTNVHYVTGEETDTTVMYLQGSTIHVSADFSDKVLYARYYNKGALTVTYLANVPYLGVAYNMPEDASITQDLESDTVPYTISYASTPTVKKQGNGTDFALLGWSTSPNATEPEYTVGQSVNLNRYNDQATMLYAVWDVIPVIVCSDATNIGSGSGGNIYFNATSYNDTVTDGFYWNTRCVTWIKHSAAENPEKVRVDFYASYVNSRNNQIITGFSRTEGEESRDAIDLINITTGNIGGYIDKSFYLDQTMWDGKVYNEEFNAYFIPIYAVYDEFVYVYQYLHYQNNRNSSQVAIHGHQYNAKYLASLYESGTVSIPLFYKSGSEYTTSNFWLYPSNLRYGDEYSVIGWAWNADATVPDGQVLAVNTGQPPVYTPSGNVNTHLTYDRIMSLNIKDVGTDGEEGICTASVDSNGVRCYTYTLHVVYDEVVETNTFRIVLDYNDGVDSLPNDDLDSVVTQDDSYTYFSSKNNMLNFDCDFSKCLPSENYDVAGWSLSRTELALDFIQYPPAQSPNSNYYSEGLVAKNLPFTVSTSDSYNKEGNFYYRRLYAVYAKSLCFDSAYQGTVNNMPDTVNVYTHYEFEGNTASITIPAAIPTRNEAVFAGWTDGVHTYQPGDVVVVESASITLSAVWQNKYNFKLVYDWNYEGGATFSELSYSNTVSHMEIDIIQSIPAREGYTFLGWAETPDAEKPAYTTPAQEGTTATIVITATSSNETTVKTLYAVWEQKTE